MGGILMKFIDITGQRFGKLTILGRSKKYSCGTILWNALCDCGGKTLVTKSNLKSGTTKSCGCLRHEPSKNSINIAGKRFGKLVAILKTRPQKDRHTKWLCKCDCGNETEVSVTKLTTGITKSCGCLRHEANGRRKSITENPIIRANGYICIRGEDRHGKWKERPQHVVIMERYIGRKLRDGETVHHKNGIRSDNGIKNLELWSKAHPPGQRVEDMISFCVDYLTQYAPEYLTILKRITA